MSADRIQTPHHQTRTAKRAIIASLIGTSLEWYDFFLYGSAAALVFGELFFPEFDPLTGTLLSFATFAVGFIARPLGGIVFGHFGDRSGRKVVLVVTLVLMGVATALIGALPTYAQIGAAAPVLLVLLRFLQGIGLGGEWGGAVLMSLEHGDPDRRGFNASWPQVGDERRHARGGVPVLGLADPVPAVGAAGPRRTVDPAHRRRDPAVHRGRAGRG
jgi:MFS family permease